MASEQEKQELKTKVTQLVERKFGGDWDRAFRHYAKKSASGSVVDREGVVRVLEDADVGNWFTRSTWAKGVTAELDTSGDGKISLREFRAVFVSSPALRGGSAAAGLGGFAGAIAG